MQDDLVSRSALLKDLEPKAQLISGSFISGIMHAIHQTKNAPAVDAVSRPVFEQIKWERDCAMQQLKDHGIPFGGIAPDVVNVVRCKDCKHEENCMKQLVLWERDHVLEQNVYQYQNLGFCSCGERRADDG